MRHQRVTDDSFSEAEAMRLVRSLGTRPSLQGHDDPANDPSRHAAITRTVEAEVIPRLLKARRTQAATPHAPPLPEVTPDEVDALTQVLLSGTQPQVTAFVEDMRQAGIGAESLFLNLLTPAARRLGVMWAEDDCDFADVTIGMLRLANVMRLVGDAFEAEVAPVRSGPRALLVQAPGEQHGFGITMVASFFRRAGWNVRSTPLPDSAALISLVRQEWFSLVGLSVACTEHLPVLADTIRAIRATSRNRAIAVMVGGFAFMNQPHLAETVGADCTAADAPQAVMQANALVSRLACRP